MSRRHAARIRAVERVQIFQPIGSPPGEPETINVMSQRAAARQPARHHADARFDGHTIADLVDLSAARGENGAVHRGQFKRGAQNRPELPTCPRSAAKVMAFGPYRGKPFAIIPREYLTWVLQWTVGDCAVGLRAFLGLSLRIAIYPVDDDPEEDADL